jgi:uncharacterized protein with HEPN domain
MPSDVAAAALCTIHENIPLAQSFVEGFDRTTFEADIRTVYAVIRCLEVISEASRRVASEVKARHSQIPWDRIAGAGNVYRHSYDNVLPGQIWMTIVESLPTLLSAIEEEVSLSGDKLRE